MDEKSKREQQKQDLLAAGLGGATSETVQRYGGAVKQHIVSYSGNDFEFGKTLAKGLKQVSEEKVNPNYEYQNIHQQAGFSAEIKDVARTNAERIIKGDSTRKIRTDDLGRVNDPLYDTFEIDKNGNIIDGTGSQMKFIGASENDPSGAGAPARALEKLQSKKFEKYLEKDVKLDVPSDYYDKMIEEADNNIKKLSSQLENQQNSGQIEQAEKIKARIDKLKKIKNNLRKSTVSSKEAEFARLHPGLSTTIDIAKISHRAGIETTKTSALIGGSVSIVKNLVSLCKGDEKPEEAIKNVIKDTATTATVGYATGFAGSALKGVMQNASTGAVRSLSKSNFPAMVVTMSVSSSKTLVKYFNGEINGLECLETLGEQGTGLIAASVFSVLGQMAIPVPVVGGLIGVMVGYALSSATYGLLVQSLNEAKLAHEQRLLIEKTCNEHIQLIGKNN